MLEIQNKKTKIQEVLEDNGRILGLENDKYHRKKQRLLGLNGTDTVLVVREILPQCILDLVRGIYPNLPGQPYMGHKW